MKLDPKQRQLLILALDRAAHPGEADNAAVAFIRLLKVRFGDAYMFLAELETQEPPRPNRGFVDYGAEWLPFGKHRGKQLRDVPPDYLLWVSRNCENMDEYLRETISRYLRDPATNLFSPPITLTTKEKCSCLNSTVQSKKTQTLFCRQELTCFK
jgi:hypothetical protein